MTALYLFTRIDQEVNRNNWFKFTADKILSKGILYTIFFNNTTLFKNLRINNSRILTFNQNISSLVKSKKVIQYLFK
jgi:hypothetical protein